MHQLKFAFGLDFFAGLSVKLFYLVEDSDSCGVNLDLLLDGATFFWDNASNIEDDVFVAAGTIVNQDIKKESFVIGRTPLIVKENKRKKK